MKKNISFMLILVYGIYMYHSSGIVVHIRTSSPMSSKLCDSPFWIKFVVFEKMDPEDPWKFLEDEADSTSDLKDFL